MGIRFSQAVTGFELACRARSLSQNTIDDYMRTARKFIAFRPDDPDLDKITATDIQSFLAVQDVSNKSLLNYYIGLSALWSWATAEGLASVHVVRKLKAPKPESRVIVPFSLTDIRAMLSVVERSKQYREKFSGQQVSFRLPYADRNRAMILLLLDTGLRATEICSLVLGDVDVKARTLTVMGKGRKERHIPFGARTGNAIWRYLAGRKDDPGDGSPLFLSSGGHPMSRDRLAHTIADIGARAGIQGAHPHRFRHTFAINYLRNGGDVYTLQNILGHSTLEMVRKYLALAQVDLETAHRRASPVEMWRL
jgi:integrase/recombinase XerD